MKGHEGEKPVPGGASLLWTPAPLSFLQVESLALCRLSSAQKVQTFLEKEGNFSITLPRIALVALH